MHDLMIFLLTIVGISSNAWAVPGFSSNCQISSNNQAAITLKSTSEENGDVFGRVGTTTVYVLFSKDTSGRSAQVSISGESSITFNTPTSTPGTFDYPVLFGQSDVAGGYTLSCSAQAP